MPFDLQPTLVSEILELRPLGADDFERLYAVASDPLIWEQHPNFDRWQPDVFRKFFDDAIESGVRRGITVTTLSEARLRSVGPFWRDLIGAAFTMAK
jgi:RimJ/RimL family protein N-acetyltransferase